MMKALELRIKDINKMAFIYELGGYCIINAVSVENLQKNIQIWWEDDYLLKPINSYATFDEVVYWETSYVGTSVDSMDTLQSLFLCGIDYSLMFFDNQKDNIFFWKKMIKNMIHQNKGMDYLFELINKFQVWRKVSLYPDCYENFSSFDYIVTGLEDILSEIKDRFLSPVEPISNYTIFSDDDNYIKWVNI